MPKPKAIDLFSGAGGLTQGLRNAGFSVVGAVEIDPVAARTYRANHPAAKLYQEDMNQLDPVVLKKSLGLRRGQLDLLAGCPPCQGYSRMRNLNGGRVVRDPKKKDLVLRFWDYVDAFRPKAVMMENVPGLEADWRYAQIKSLLRGAGYRIVLSEARDAQKFEVPQRRKRLILIAIRTKGTFVEPAPLPKVTVRQAIAHLPLAGSSGDPIHDIPENRTPEILARIRDIPRDGGSRKDLPRERQLRCHLESTGFKDVYGRMSWDDVAPTITGGCFNPSKGRFLHPEENRAITMREAALLQTFPEDYVFLKPLNKQVIALMIGNALPPKFIEHHARPIIAALRKIRIGEDKQS